MIRVFSGNLLIREADECRALDVDGLRQELQGCCRAAGVRDAWLSEHIALAAEEHLAQRQGSGSDIPSRQDVDRLVVRLLTDTGYVDVAAEFCRCREIPPGSMAVGMSAWDGPRIRRVLAASLPFGPQQLDAVSDAVVRRLQALGFVEVTDRLITELAAHVTKTKRPGVGEDRHAPDSPWLFPPQHPTALLDSRGKELVRAGVIEIRPVSRLLPVARARFDVAALGRHLGTAPLLELVFLPSLRQACGNVLRVLDVVGDEVAARRGQGRGHPARLFISGIARVVAEQFGLPSPGRRRALAGEILSVVRHELTRRMDADLIVTIWE